MAKLKGRITPQAVRSFIKRNIFYVITFFAMQLVVLPQVVFPSLEASAMFSVPGIPTVFISAAITLALKIAMYVRSLDAKKYRKDVEYGSARWGTPEEIAPFMDADTRNNIILTQTEGLMMESRPADISLARNKNVLVIGGSGSGKTRFFAKGNLMQTDSEKHPVSFVVTDPKGTLLLEMGDFLEKQEYKIKVLNTIDMSKSHKYNPFAYIRREKDILKFVTAFIANTKGEGQGGDPFWTKAETLLYQALIGYIYYEADEHEKNINTLIDMINNMDVVEDDDTHENPVDLMFKELEQGKLEYITEIDENGNENTIERLITDPGHPEYAEPKPDHFAVRQYKKYKLAAGKTTKSILISAGARLSPFDMEEVRELMSDDNLELDNLGGTHTGATKTVRKKAPIEGSRKGTKGVEGKDWKWKRRQEKITDKTKYAFFVIISDTDATFNFIPGIMYSQLFNLLCDKADNDFDGRLPVHVRCILDEFANIGLIPNFERLISTIRSREISASILLQTLSQLKAIYKDNMETIIGNCDSTLFLGGKEKSTLKDISETLGKETIDLMNTSMNFAQQKTHGQSYQKLGKDLMSVDEVATMDGSKCILQVRGIRPFFSKKYDPTKHRHYKFLADYDEDLTYEIVGRAVKKPIDLQSIKEENMKMRKAKMRARTLEYRGGEKINERYEQ